MGVDTKGYLNKEVTGKQVFDVVVSKYDKEAFFDIKIDSYDNEEMGGIYFKDGEDNRKIFYCVTGDKVEETEFANGEKHVAIILGKWGNSVEIIAEIIKCFGGYIDESDCDDVGAYYIPKDGDFKYSKYIEERNKIISVLTKELNESEKIKIATEILKHKEEIKKLL